MNRKPKSANHGFTLIELLIVIGIIAILAGILFPVFASAREKARTSSCASNMRQLATGLLAYAQDYDESFPFGIGCYGTMMSPYFGVTGEDSSNDANMAGAGWAGEIMSHVKSTAVFTCPDDLTQLTYPKVTAVSYAINANTAGASAIRMASPSLTVLLAEVQGAQVLLLDPSEGTNGYTTVPANGMLSPSTNGFYVTSTFTGYQSFSRTDNVTGYTDAPINTLNGAAPSFSGSIDPNVKIVAGQIGGTHYLTSMPASYANAAGLHQGGANYVCADGHAKWFLPQQVSSGVNQGTGVCPQDSWYETGTCMSPGRAAVPVAAGTAALGPYRATFATF